MNLRISAILIVMCLLGMACKKKGSDAPAICCSTAYTDSLHIPYDTIGIEGIFSAHIITDSGNTPPTNKIIYDSWLAAAGTDVQIVANGRVLSRFAGQHRLVLNEYTRDSTGNLPLAWAVTDNGALSFTYTNTNVFPTCSYVFLDTIVASGGTLFAFNSGNIKDADTVLMEVTLPTDNNNFSTLKYYTVAEGSVTITDSVTQLLTGKRIRISITAISHQDYLINGYRCLFMKQHTETNYCWFK